MCEGGRSSSSAAAGDKKKRARARRGRSGPKDGRRAAANGERGGVAIVCTPRTAMLARLDKDRFRCSIVAAPLDANESGAAGRHARQRENVIVQRNECRRAKTRTRAPRVKPCVQRPRHNCRYTCPSLSSIRGILRAMDAPNRVLGIYRKMIKLARLLPAAERSGAMSRIRHSFRESRSETSPERCAVPGRRAATRLACFF